MLLQWVYLVIVLFPLISAEAFSVPSVLMIMLRQGPITLYTDDRVDPNFCPIFFAVILASKRERERDRK